MNLVDVLTEEGFSGIPAEYNTSNSTNVYERVAAESNPDYAPMLASITKHMDNDLNRKRALFGVLNSIKQRRDAITDATTKFNREVNLERLKSLLDMKEKLLELKTKKSLGLGDGGLTYDQKVALEDLKLKNKKNFADYFTDILKTRGENKNTQNITLDNAKTENKMKAKTHSTNEDLRKEETVQKDKVDFQNLKHGNSMELVNTKHNNNKDLQIFKNVLASELIDTKHDYSVDEMLMKAILASEGLEEKNTYAKDLVTHRANEGIRLDNSKTENKKGVENLKYINKTNAEDQSYTNKLDLLTTKITGQKDVKGIEKEIQKDKNETNKTIQESRERNKQTDERIQEKKFEGIKLNTSMGTNKGYTPPDVKNFNNPPPPPPPNNNNYIGLLKRGWDYITKDKNEKSNEPQETKEQQKLSRLYSPRYGVNPVISDEDFLMAELGIFDETDFA